MGDMKEFPVSIRLYLKHYRWRRIDPVPWTALGKPLSECRLALVSSAGLVLPHRAGFDDSVRGGDPSFQEIPAGVDVSTLVDGHRSAAFDHEGMRRDANLVFPIDRVKELAESGRIGSVNHRHLSLMGSLTAPGRLMKYWAPKAAQCLAEDDVDVVLLVPV